MYFCDFSVPYDAVIQNYHFTTILLSYLPSESRITNHVKLKTAMFDHIRRSFIC